MERVAVAADVGPAPVVHAHPVLTAAAGQLERLAARVEEEDLAADRDRLCLRPVGGDERQPPSRLVETWKRLSRPQRNELSIPSPAGSLPKPVKTTRRTSALPSPSVSLR